MQKLKIAGVSKSVLIGILVICLIATLSFASCGKSEDSGSGEEEKALDVIKIGNIYSDDASRLSPILVAIQKGFFEEEGIEIEDKGTIAIPEETAALDAGTVDTTGLMDSEAIRSIDQGFNLIKVANSTSTSEEKVHMTFLVKKDSGIERGRDLVGKKVGTASPVGGCTAGFPLYFAKEDGVEDPKGDVELVQVPEENLDAALDKDEVDVIGTHLSRQQAEKLFPQYKILFTDWDILEDVGGDVGWYFKKDYVDANNDLIKRFVRAITKVNKFISENEEEASKIYVDNARSVNEELFRVENFSVDPTTDASHIQFWLDEFAGNQSVYELENKDSTPEDYYTNEFIEVS